VKDKENKEMSECTFAPTLVSKQKSVTRPSFQPSFQQHMTSVPVEEHRIQMPGQTMAKQSKHKPYKNDSIADSDSIAHSTPQTSIMLKNQYSNASTLNKRKMKPDHYQSTHMMISNGNNNFTVTATARSNNSSMVQQHN